MVWELDFTSLVGALFYNRSRTNPIDWCSAVFLLPSNKLPDLQASMNPCFWLHALGSEHVSADPREGCNRDTERESCQLEDTEVNTKKPKADLEQRADRKRDKSGSEVTETTTPDAAQEFRKLIYPCLSLCVSLYIPMPEYLCGWAPRPLTVIE